MPNFSSLPLAVLSLVSLMGKQCRVGRGPVSPGGFAVRRPSTCVPVLVSW